MDTSIRTTVEDTTKNKLKSLKTWYLKIILLWTEQKLQVKSKKYFCEDHSCGSRKAVLLCCRNTKPQMHREAQWSVTIEVRILLRMNKEELKSSLSTPCVDRGTGYPFPTSTTFAFNLELFIPCPFCECLISMNVAHDRARQLTFRYSVSFLYQSYYRKWQRQRYS